MKAKLEICKHCDRYRWNVPMFGDDVSWSCMDKIVYDDIAYATTIDMTPESNVPSWCPMTTEHAVSQ